VDKLTPRVGVFIDAENLPARTVAGIFDIASRYGRIVERRVYGDFTREALRPWAAAVPHYALDLRIAQASISGKNSSDILLAIDATESLGRAEIDVFCIASTDSDFAHLASRIRMRGRQVVGLGGPKANDVFRAAFDAFFELEVERSPERSESSKVVALKRTADIRPYVARALTSLGHDPGEWLDVSRLAQVIKQLNPGFCAKDFGSAKFSTVLKQSGVLETRMDGTKRMFIRMRRQSQAG